MDGFGFNWFNDRGIFSPSAGADSDEYTSVDSGAYSVSSEDNKYTPDAERFCENGKSIRERSARAQISHDQRQLTTQNLADSSGYRIPLKMVRNEQAEKYHWTHAQRQLTSIISKYDMCLLTGSKDDKDLGAIVLLGGKAHRVVSHPQLFRNEIILNPNYQDLSDNLELSAFKGEFERVGSASVIIIDKKSSGKVRGKDELLIKSINNFLPGMPADKGRLYTASMTYEDEYGEKRWDGFQFKVFPTPGSTPKSDNTGTGPSEWVYVYQKDYLQVCIESGDSCQLELIRPSKSLPDTVNHSVEYSNTTSNTVHVSLAQFRCLKTKNIDINGKEALLPVRVGKFVYYAEPLIESEEPLSDTPIKMSVLVSPQPKNIEIEPFSGDLKVATHCNLSLSWHRYYLPETEVTEAKLGVIKQAIRHAIEKVPLQPGKKFTAHFKDDRTGELVILECQVNSVGGSGTGSESNIFTADENTQLVYTATDPAILNGGKVQERQLGDVLTLLTDGLAGIDDVAEQIANRIIIPFGKDGCERGLLLYGPPGTGKSALASNIGKALQALPGNVQIINAASVMDETPQKSCERFKKLFDSAREASNLGNKERFVIFFDEVDTMLPTGGMSSDIRKAIQSQLQVLMDSGNENTLRNVVIVAATNEDPERLPVALRRRGRFSVQLQMGLPNYQHRLKLLESGLEKLKDKGCETNQLDVKFLAKLTENKSCKDITELVKETFKNAELADTKKLTNELFEKTLVNPDLASLNKIDALNEFPLSERFHATACENIALKELRNVLSAVKDFAGRKAVVLVKAGAGARRTNCIHKLLEGTEGFDYYSAVPVSSKMLKPCINSIQSAGKALRSVLIVEGTETMAAQKSMLHSPADVGAAWEAYKKLQSKSGALILVADEKACDRDLIQTLNIVEPVMPVITLPGKIGPKEMAHYLESNFNATEDDRKEILRIFAEKGCSAAEFTSLVDFCSKQNSGQTTWDTESLQSVLNSNNLFTTSMYS